MIEKTLTSPKPSEIPIANNFREAFRQYNGVLGGMVVLIILLSSINDSFFATNNITNIILQVSIITIIAYGITHVLLLGDTDLSVGSTVTLVGISTAPGASWGIPFVLLTPLPIITALALGVINGDLAAIAGIPLSIITIAIMRIFHSVAYIVADSVPIMTKDDAFLTLENGESLCIPVPVWMLTVSLLIGHFIPTRTTFEREIYIIGGNRETAIYSGINVIRLKIRVFMVTAALAGISGMILASRFYSGQPNSTLSYELDAIVVTIPEGTNPSDDYRTVVGTVIGILTIDVTSNGMNLMDVSYFYQMIVKGLVILVAVYFDVRNRRKRS